MKKQVTLTALAIATAMAATSAQAEDIEVSGKVFFDYSASSATGSADTSGGNISRTYLTAKKSINDIWSAKVTFDSALNAGHSGKDSEVFLKTAQLTGKFSDALNVKLGMIGTPWVGYEDKLNKHRHVAKSFVDSNKLDSSADAGIGVFGKTGMFSYDIVSINGGGYGAVATSEKTDLNLRVGVKPIKGLTVDLGYRTGYKGAFEAGVSENENTLTQFLVTYGATRGELSYRAAFNIITNEVNDQLTSTTATESGQELWAWARKGKFGGYLRYETLDNGVAGDAIQNRTVLSADYYATKGVVISLVSDSTTNAGHNTGDTKSKTGVFTQFKF